LTLPLLYAGKSPTLYSGSGNGFEGRIDDFQVSLRVCEET
jgi:hypothetical protein